MFAVFIVGLFWFTHGNGFPSFYHPEEEIRASQLIKGDWDLHHPLLSAFTTKLLKTVLHVPDDLQAVVQLGRTVSAFFAVGSIVCLESSRLPSRQFCGGRVAFLFVALSASIFRPRTYDEREQFTDVRRQSDAPGHCASRTKSHRAQSLAAWLQCGNCCFGQVHRSSIVHPRLDRRSSQWWARVSRQQGRGIRPWLFCLLYSSSTSMR